ncbi:MAG: signal peptidase I [Lachnospiraceae bacterium]|nr:signal peptidase I [Lachnospiraceae bacterium]
MDLFTYEDNSILRSVIRGIVYVVVLISLAWFLVYAFMGQTIINGQSMSPLLNAEDVCLVDRLKYDLGRPDRFDIVLFERADSEKLNVKRVIGLPGDNVQIVNGLIYINGERLEDERIGSISLAGIAENVVELGKDEYFVLGDNADSSEDSRFANIGNVQRKSIKGKLWLKIRPVSEVGLLN